MLYHSVLLAPSKTSTMRIALLFIGTFLLTCHSVDSLSCVPCSEVECSTPKNCKGGTVLGICNCCLVCAKVEGETCGGSWDMEGRCDSGLRCSVTDWRPEKYGVGTCKPGKLIYARVFICQKWPARPAVPI